MEFIAKLRLTGTTIMAVTPHVAVLSTSNLEQFCSACAEPAPQSGLKRCPRCKALWYCNSVCTECFRRHFPVLILSAPNRSAKIETGPGISESVRLYRNGPRPPLHRTLPYQEKR